MTSTVYIAKNVYGGDGLGRLGDGRVIFVPGAWAGENVKAEIVEEKKHYVKARLVEVVEAAPERVAAEAVGATAPGMVYAALTFRGEREAKTAQLRDFFSRARIACGAIDEHPEPEHVLNYRNKIVYHFAKQRGQWVIGYRTEPSHEIVDMAVDPLARPEINAKLAEIRRSVQTLLTTGPEAVRRETARKGNVTIRWTPKTGVKWWIGDAPHGMVLKETTCGRDFEVPADGFYQVNPEVGDALVRHVTEAYAAGSGVAPDILDLYCGVGVFGLCCAARAPSGAHLTGVESGRQAIDFARRNAAAQNVTGATFIAEQVGRCLKRLDAGANATVIVDPPRGGLEHSVTRYLAGCGAPRIFYVSCDPATLMRDLRELTRTYEVVSARRFDMFPRTARFETFVELRLK